MVVGKRTFIAGTKALIFDIEGTTTSISFVKDKLFPYIRENIKDFVVRHWNEEEFKEALALIKEQAKLDVTNSVEGAVLIADDGTEEELQEAVVKNILWQMDCDAKTLPLKTLQGHILREGYKQGQLKGHLYADVVPCLRAWAQSGLKLYVYSSGSVDAQKLLFSHSQEGDVLDLFEGHFDTAVGRKTDSQSYAEIVKQLDYQPDEVVFFTDVSKEATAAEDAGLTAVLIVREGNADLAEEDRLRFQVINTFEDFECELPAKRRKVSVEVEETPVPDASTAEVKVDTVEPPTEVSGDSKGEEVAAVAEEVEMEDVSKTTEATTIAEKTEMVVNDETGSAHNVEKKGPVETADMTPVAVESGAVVGESEAVVGKSEAVVDKSEAVVDKSEAVVGESEAVVGKSEAVISKTTTEYKPTESDKIVEPIVEEPRDSVEGAKEAETKEKSDGASEEGVSIVESPNKTVLQDEQGEKVEVKELLIKEGADNESVKEVLENTESVPEEVESEKILVNAVVTTESSMEVNVSDLENETVPDQGDAVVTDGAAVNVVDITEAATKQEAIKNDKVVTKESEATDPEVCGKTVAEDAVQKDVVASEEKGQGDAPNVVELKEKPSDADDKVPLAAKSGGDGAGEEAEIQVTD